MGITQKLTDKGINNRILYNFIANVQTLANELRTDHDSFKTAVDELNTLTDELHDDHATFKTAVDELNTLTDELHDDHATFKTAVDNTKTILGDMCLSAAGLAIGTASKAKVKIVNTVTYLIDGVFKSKTSAEVAFTATTHDVADGSNAFFVISLQADGTATITKGADDAALTTITPPAGECVIGYVNIAASGAIFDASTDLLDAGHLTVTYTDTAFLTHQIGAAPATLTASKASAGPATLTATKATAGPASISAAALDKDSL